MQEAKLLAFDIGLDKIDTIDPEFPDDGVEGRQRYELLRDPVPTVPRRREMAKPKPRLPRPLTGRVSVPSSEIALSAIGSTTTLASPCSHTTLPRIERAKVPGSTA